MSVFLMFTLSSMPLFHQWFSEWAKRLRIASPTIGQRDKKQAPVYLVS